VDADAAARLCWVTLRSFRKGTMRWANSMMSMGTTVLVSTSVEKV
jgi:hypothetical protein